jgi:hypothetical protein
MKAILFKLLDFDDLAGFIGNPAQAWRDGFGGKAAAVDKSDRIFPIT